MDGSGGATHGVAVPGLEQEFHRRRCGKLGLSVRRSRRSIAEQVRLFHDAGVHVGTHAIGDRAIDWVVDTYAQVLAEKPTVGFEHSIIHANIPSDHAIETMALLRAQVRCRLSGSASALSPGGSAIPMRGISARERSLRLIPLKTYLDKGIRWGGGSDYPVTPLPARYGLWSSVERETLEGNLRAPSLRHRGGGRHSRGAALLHALGRAAAVPGRPHGIARDRARTRISRSGTRIPTACRRRSCAICTARSRCCRARSCSMPT